jgi:G8 domain
VITIRQTTTNFSSTVSIIPLAPFPVKIDRSAIPVCPHSATGLKRWHETSTWGGVLPATGKNVILPTSSRIIIDQDISERLGIVTIPLSSELIIGSNRFGIRINATGFNVLGKLTAGSETCHIRNTITITLHGRRPRHASTLNPPSLYKGIVVSGKLNLHGHRFYPTWTRLAASVEIGQKEMWLQQKVNWKPRQRIVLVTSSIKDSRDYNQNEVLTIRSVNNKPSTSLGIGSIVYVTQPVKYRHIANEYYQVEVGLLSRSIKIQGSSSDSEPNRNDRDPGNCKDPEYDSSSTYYYQTTQPCMNKELSGFGGHIRVEGKGIGQVEGVELYRMGQTNVRGRYPMHFHLLGSCPTCYFKSSSIHRSFYRCVAIHGTHDTLTTENVAYNVIGYCYYLEDGVEERNTISYNLAAHIHTIGPAMVRGFGQKTYQYVEGPNLTLPADVTASGFYITNVHNNIVGNAASGVRNLTSIVSVCTRDHTHLLYVY